MRVDYDGYTIRKTEKKKRGNEEGESGGPIEAACQSSSFLPRASKACSRFQTSSSLWKPSQQVGGLYSNQERESRSSRGGTLSRNKYASPSKHDESGCGARTSCASRAKRDSSLLGIGELR